MAVVCDASHLAAMTQPFFVVPFVGVDEFSSDLGIDARIAEIRDEQDSLTPEDFTELALIRR